MLNAPSTLLLWGSREQYAEKSCHYTYCAHPRASTCSHIILYSSAGWAKVKRERETSLTISRNDPQGHRVSSLFDQVDDIRVGFIGDGASVYSQDPVSNFQLPATVGWTSFDDATYFMRHCHTCVSSFDRACMSYNSDGDFCFLIVVFGGDGEKGEKEREKEGKKRNWGVNTPSHPAEVQTFS